MAATGMWAPDERPPLHLSAAEAVAWDEARRRPQSVPEQRFAGNDRVFIVDERGLPGHVAEYSGYPGLVYADSGGSTVSVIVSRREHRSLILVPRHLVKADRRKPRA